MEVKLDLVKFEQAKALKELGFYCYSDNARELYVTSNEISWEQEIEIPYSDNDEYITRHETLPVEVIGQLLYNVQKKYGYKNKFQTVYAPTIELAAKWLRKEKDFHITPEYRTLGEKIIYYCKINGHCLEENNTLKRLLFNSYEDALSAGIDKVIEILKNN